MRFTKIYANPKGKDLGNEWIEFELSNKNLVGKKIEIFSKTQKNSKKIYEGQISKEKLQRVIPKSVPNKNIHLLLKVNGIVHDEIKTTNAAQDQILQKVETIKPFNNRETKWVANKTEIQSESWKINVSQTSGNQKLSKHPPSWLTKKLLTPKSIFLTKEVKSEKGLEIQEIKLLKQEITNMRNMHSHFVFLWPIIITLLVFTILQVFKTYCRKQ